MDIFSTENSSLSTPRISFSHNLDNSFIETYPSRSDSHSHSHSDSDFDFCVTGDPIRNEASSADELFCNGLIRPNYDEEKRLFVANNSTDDLFCDDGKYLGRNRQLVANTSTDEIFRDGDYLIPTGLAVANSYADECAGVAHHEKGLVVATSSKHVSSPLLPDSMDTATDRSGKQEISKEIEGYDGNQSKSFWRIKRSSSLHFESTKPKSSFWSSLPLLSRSNSTGAVAKDRHNNKQNQLQKQSKKSSMAAYSSSMKPPLKSNYGGAGAYRISPVLNVPPPFISKGAANLLGLSSFFGHSNDQKNKKHSS